MKNYPLNHIRSDLLVICCVLVLASGCVSGNSPLHSALWGKRSAKVAQLVETGADVNARGALGFTPLHIAALNNDTNSLALLLTKGAEIDATLSPGVIDTLGNNRHLTFQGANVNFGQVYMEGRAWGVLAANGAGFTPLALAAQASASATVALLVKAGANVNARDWVGMTPLAWATLSGDRKAVQELLASNADPQIADNNGLTPLHQAAYICYGKIDLTAADLTAIVDALISKGANINTTDKHGQTPLQLALNNKLVINKIDKNAYLAQVFRERGGTAGPGQPANTNR